MPLSLALETLDVTLSRFASGDSSMLDVLETLLGEKLTTRESRRVRMELRTAQLRAIKTLSFHLSSIMVKVMFF